MPRADLLAAVDARGARHRRRRLAWLVLLAAAAAAAWTLAPPPVRRHWIDGAFAVAGRTPPLRPAAASRPAALRRPRVEPTVAAEPSAPEPPSATTEPAQEPGADARTEERRLLVVRPLPEWLAEIAAQAGLGVIVAPEISGQASAAFDDATPWGERIAALARIHGFSYEVGERLIEVWATPRAEDAVGGEPAVKRGDEAGPPVYGEAPAFALQEPPEPEEPPRLTEVVRPVHARADDLVAAIAKAARASDVQVAPDPGSNAVVIAGPETAVLGIARLVYSLDVPRRRFVLEAEILELSRTARRELGVRWSIEGDTVGAEVDFPAADAPGESSGILVATDGSYTLRARINALEADGHVRIVSRPRVVVLEGRPASIESVRILRVRFPERTAIVGEAEDAGAVAGGRAVEEIPVGVTLRVEPSMRGDGRIVLRIRAKSSTLGPPQPPDDIPEELSRMVDAEVAVGDGETAVLGGLLREGSSRSGAGVPVLRSVPLLGLLFGKREHEEDGEELVVLVTPRLLPS